MAKKRRKWSVSKSQAIRDVLQNNPKATPKRIKAALARRGIEVSDSLISFVKYRAPRLKKGPKKATTAKKRGRPRKAGHANGEVSFEHLLWAKEFSSRLGGVERAQQALAMLEKLQ